MYILLLKLLILYLKKNYILLIIIIKLSAKNKFKLYKNLSKNLHNKLIKKLSDIQI
jgi:hypothetical protein